MGLCSIGCGDKTFYSLPCKKDKESEGEEKAFAVANMWSRDSSQVDVLVVRCLIHYAVRWHGDLFILSK